jgi:hypothetical protein
MRAELGLVVGGALCVTLAMVIMQFDSMGLVDSLQGRLSRAARCKADLVWCVLLSSHHKNQPCDADVMPMFEPSWGAPCLSFWRAWVRLPAALEQPWNVWPHAG